MAAEVIADLQLIHSIRKARRIRRAKLRMCRRMILKMGDNRNGC